MELENEHQTKTWNPNKDHGRLVDQGPYRATRLWNDAIRMFRGGMPVGRHRRQMRVYENSFPATDAVDWLHEHLKENPNFGEHVTRIQTLQLLTKFLKTGVIEHVRGSKKVDDFKDNGDLYRFTNKSPFRVLRTPGRPALVCVTNLNEDSFGCSPKLVKTSDGTPVSTKKAAVSTPRSRKSRLFSPIASEKLPECQVVVRQLGTQEVEEVWKNVLLGRLANVLGVTSLDDILPSRHIYSKWIIHNTTRVDKKGITEPLDKSEELPPWIMAAMKCLANWPNASGSGSCLPNYPGFEQDVFKVVRDYFVLLDSPLATFQLYMAFITSFIRAEFHDISVRTPSKQKKADEIFESKSLASFDSVENLMMDMTAHPSRQSVQPSELLVPTPPVESRAQPQVPARDVSRCSLSSAASSKNSSDATKSTVCCASESEENKLNTLQRQQFTSGQNTLQRQQFTSGQNTLQRQQFTSGQIPVENKMSTLQRREESRSRKRQLSLKGNISIVDRATGEVLSTSQLVTAELPPNTCFETAFTSESPVTRIIPQKSIDFLHVINSGTSHSSFLASSSPRTSEAGRCRPKSVAFSSEGRASVDRYLHQLPKCDGWGVGLPGFGADMCSVQAKQVFVNSEGNVMSPSKSMSVDNLNFSGLRLKPSPGFNSTQQRYSDERTVRQAFGDLSPNETSDSLCSRSEDSQSFQNTKSIRRGMLREDSLTSLKSCQSSVRRMKNRQRNKNLKNVDLYGTIGPKTGGYVNFALVNSPDSQPLQDSAVFKEPPIPRQLRSHLSSSDFVGVPRSRASIASTNSISSHRSFQQPQLDSSSKVSSMHSSPDYENMRHLSQLFSHSSINLSDRSRDRTPYGQTAPLRKTSVWQRFINSPSLLTSEGKAVAIESFQLLCLLIPPGNRRQLTLLLRCMSKMAENDKMILDTDTSVRAVVLSTFSRAILSPECKSDIDDLLVLRIVSFMMDNHVEILTPPETLQQLVEERLASLQREQILFSPTVRGPMSYCQQVSNEEYEKQKLTLSQLSLLGLLDQIVNDQNMSSKDKRKRIKKFKENYPEIFSKRFPTAEKLQEVLPNNNKKGMFRFSSLTKLRGMRM